MNGEQEHGVAMLTTIFGNAMRDSHYDGVIITLHDAPLPNEIAIICAYANRGRPNHPVGGPTASEIKSQDGLT